ncbi:MAG: enoyl-CoA hydratase/isomerase family protein [Ignavibacteriaceae bacterium]|nr:enoyl-CoA hydratase/isomerase family protein [Ignavibacteriaceae bacterium]
MNYQNLILEQQDTIAIVKINRPEKLNSLDKLTLEELKHIFNSLNENDSILVIVITGTGEKAFAAGADISEISQLDMISAKSFSEKGQEVFYSIENMKKPVIAAVNGFALGGGCELALSCHIRIASENAKFGQPEVNLGLIPGYGGTQRLTRLINSGRSAEMILTGDVIDANEALRIGLVNHVYPKTDLLTKAIEIAKKISSKGQQAIRLALKAINMVDQVSDAEGQKYEASLFAICCGTEDFKEGTNAFLQKRKPIFKNK